MENNQVFNLLNRKFLEHKNVVDLVEQSMDALTNKENPEYDQNFTDEAYKKLLNSKKEITDFLQVIMEENLPSDLKSKFTIDYNTLLNEINNNINKISPFVSNNVLNIEGGKKKRKSKRKTKAKRKSHKRRRTNKRKSKAKSEEKTTELQSQKDSIFRLLLEKKKIK